MIAVLSLLGVILGSFVNALTWRLHEQAQLARAGKKTAASKAKKHLNAKELSVVHGRSMCPSCYHTLAAVDLVPVLSWLWLRGRCRYCKESISWQYPVVELLTGILFAWSFAAWDRPLHGVVVFQLACWLALLIGFVALAVYDVHWFLLPDKLVLPVTVLAALDVLVVALWRQSWSALYMPLLGGFVIFGLFWTLFQVSKGGWIGGGDVKLAVALGLLAGTPFRALTVIFFASLIGTVASIPLLMRGRKGLQARLPFGPCLLLATVIVVLHGDSIANWYQHLILFSH